MALFKILAGKEKVSNGKSIMTFDESLSTPIPNASGIEWHEGWAYVTPDTGNMFIDVSNNGKPKRIKIGELADKALQAIADHEGNIFIETYIKDIELNANASAPYYRIIKPDNSKSYSVDIPVASESIAGVITADTTAVQVLAGPKTFTGQIIIKGDKSTKPLITSNLLGSNGETGLGPLYLQFGNEVNDVVYLGKTGGATITDNGQQYSGNAATATRALQDMDEHPIIDWYVSTISLKDDASLPQYRIHDGTGVARTDLVNLPVASDTYAGVITANRTTLQTLTGPKAIDDKGSLTILGKDAFIYSGIQPQETKKEYSIWFSDSDGIPKYSIGLGYNPAYEETWLGDSGWPNPYSCLFVDRVKGLAEQALQDDEGHVLRTHYLSSILLTDNDTAPFYTLYQGDGRPRKDGPNSETNFKLLVPVASDTNAGIVTANRTTEQIFTGPKKIDDRGSLTIAGDFAYSGINTANTTSGIERKLWFESVDNGVLGRPEITENLTYNSKTQTLTVAHLTGLATHATGDENGLNIADNYLIETIFNHNKDINPDSPYYTFMLGNGDLQKDVKKEVNKIYLPIASQTMAGIVTCKADQEFGGKKTFAGSVVILGTHEQKKFMTRGIVGSDGSGDIGDLYLQFGNNTEHNDIFLGSTGAYKITEDGAEYTGNAATATNALNDANGNEINETYIGSIILQNNLTTGEAGTANTPRYVINKGDGTARGDYIDIPIASTTQAGIITTLAQSFTGVKDFAGFNYSGIKDNKANTGTHYLWMGLSSALGTPVYSSKLQYVPSTDTLTCANFAGNASSATKAINDGDNVAITSRYISNLEIANTYKLKASTPEGVLATLSLPFAASDSCGGVATSAKKWNNSATITLGGHLAGSVKFDGPGAYTLSASVSAAAFENAFNGRYVQIIGDTMTGGLTTPNLVLSSSSDIKHIEFKRASANYLAAPASGYFCFVPNGKGVSVANSALVVEGTSVYPGTTGTVSLGTSSKKWSAVYANKVYNAVWNDYAECRKAETLEPGRVVVEDASGEMKISTERLQPGANIISDTFGTCMGETDECKSPIAVAGRVLAYTYEDQNTYPLGAAVCAAPNGTVSLMTREEIREYPERIIGTVSEIPNYKVWGSGNVVVNNRIWIKVR